MTSLVIADGLVANEGSCCTADLVVDDCVVSAVLDAARTSLHEEG